jgi:DNA-binding MarR family transcriptional regulator
MNKHSLNLDQQLCFAVYAASREMTKLYRPLLEELDVTYPQYITLLALWEHQELTVKELGQLLFLDSGTLTPMLKRMESRGLVVRKRDQKDERRVNVRVTEKGFLLQDKASCIPEALLSEAGSKQLNVSELLSSVKSLLYFVSDYNQTQDKTPPSV